MFLLLNGAFGIGKTTAAERLARRLPDARIFDPERIGFVVRRLPAWTLGLPRQPEDYQDLALWRRLIVVGAMLAHRRPGVVIVPMAFSNRAYHEAFAGSLSARAPVRAACLVAPLATVRARLAERAAAEGGRPSAWQLRRAAECCAAHVDPAFGAPVDATPDPDAIAAALERLVLTRA